MKNRNSGKEIEFYCEKRINEICPFSGTKCKKINRADHGVCSVIHKGVSQVICPNLLSKCSFIDFIAANLLNSSDYLCIREVKVGNNFLDYLLIDKNSRYNYCGVELQALDTTGNYRYVFGEKVKPFCINWKTTKKTIISQIVTEARFFNNVGKPLVLVLQDSLFDYIGFDQTQFNKNKQIHVLPVHYEKGTFRLGRMYSYGTEDIKKLMIDEEQVDLNSIVDKFLVEMK